GILPDLFREGQGIVAQGHLVDANTVDAFEVLAKHDEEYMPPEVAEALEGMEHFKPEYTEAQLKGSGH
ncbi:cytochrome c maturation protein CcmE, partial [Agarivorans sp.]|uniref:cytochrome c maturation protein CcmE domain-containing protein n=1 Tax=Agarivorans sp. TaxID=1872412 RepID=UPI003D00E077